MLPIIIFGLLAGLPVLVAVLFRVSAVLLFTSIAVGNFLVLYLSDDVVLAVNAFTKDKNVTMAVQFALLLAPVVLALLLLRKTVTKGKLILHVVALVGCGLSIAVMALPIFASDVQAQIFKMPLGDIFKNSQDLIVGITAIVVLLLMLSTYRHKEGKGKKHH